MTEGGPLRGPGGAGGEQEPPSTPPAASDLGPSRSWRSRPQPHAPAKQAFGSLVEGLPIVHAGDIKAEKHLGEGAASTKSAVSYILPAACSCVYCTPLRHGHCCRCLWGGRALLLQPCRQRGGGSRGQASTRGWWRKVGALEKHGPRSCCQLDCPEVWLGHVSLEKMRAAGPPSIGAFIEYSSA